MTPGYGRVEVPSSLDDNGKKVVKGDKVILIPHRFVGNFLDQPPVGLILTVELCAVWTANGNHSTFLIAKDWRMWLPSDAFVLLSDLHS